MNPNVYRLLVILALILLAPAAARADGYTFAYDFGSECG
jgi:hypothetical protein